MTSGGQVHPQPVWRGRQPRDRPDEVVEPLERVDAGQGDHLDGAGVAGCGAAIAAQVLGGEFDHRIAVRDAGEGPDRGALLPLGGPPDPRAAAHDPVFDEPPPQQLLEVFGGIAVLDELAPRAVRHAEVWRAPGHAGGCGERVPRIPGTF